MSAVSARRRPDRDERSTGGLQQTGPKPLRCAIYTRKSTENGLEQAFNSLDNQREAAEAYIKSQAHEGWRLLPGTYDDGGFSGGSLERPALQRLLAEVGAGRVDVIVVYKVDRLTRSLSDFAKLVDLFDQHGVSFVSVTQAFNTTTSMGRLTLNVLLSFAQFEREVTGERIRDKIAASKKKGMRVGGPVPLGYTVHDKRLVPEPAEAEQVRLIFRRYRELGTLALLLDDLRERGIRTKVSPLRDGRVRGGIVFERGALAALLKNRSYVGEVIHKGCHYPGQHASIVEQDLFDAVQAALASRARNTGTDRINAGSLLQGLLYDQQGRRMLASATKKNGARYRYYASAASAQGSAPEASPKTRVSAPDIEAAVIAALGLDAPHQSRSMSENDPDEPPTLADQLLDRIERVILRPGAIEIVPRDGDWNKDGRQQASTIVPWSPAPRRRRRAIIGVPDPHRPTRPIRAETRARLISGIARARGWLAALGDGRVTDLKAIAARQGYSERHVRSTLNLAFLSPEIVQAAVDGTLPDGSGIVALADLPADWAMQGHHLSTTGHDWQDNEAA